MKHIILNLNQILLKIKDEYKLTNTVLANDVLKVTGGQITNYLNLKSILSKEKGYLLDDYLRRNHNKSIYDYIFSITKESGYLFHGSKNEIIGEINLNISEETHDFGKGFYLGETFLQSSTWAADDLCKGNIYKFKLDLTNLKVKELVGIEWVFFIAVNRRKIEENENTKEIFKFYKSICDEEYDVIIGKIADDKMGMSMESFFANEMYDTTLYKCLSQLKIGDQICIKTELAKTKLKMVESYKLEQDLKELINEYAISQRNEASSNANNIKNNNNQVIGQKFNDLLKTYKYGK